MLNGSALHCSPTCFRSSWLTGSLFIWVPVSPSKRETAIVIEYSIGEPFNKSGNGIQLCINVLCWGERSHHHFNVQAVLKEHLACHHSRPWEPNDMDFFFLCTFVWMFLLPNILYGYLAYFPQPSLSTSPCSRWRDTSSLQKVIVMKKPLRRFWLSALFFSICMQCVYGWRKKGGFLMIFPGRAEVGVHVYISVCEHVKKKTDRRWRYLGSMPSFLNISPDSSSGFVCLIDCLEALSPWRGPWLFIACVWRVRCCGSACSLLSVCVGDGKTP